jgi:hypothetical protein
MALTGACRRAVSKSQSVSVVAGDLHYKAWYFCCSVTRRSGRPRSHHVRQHPPHLFRLCRFCCASCATAASGSAISSATKPATTRNYNYSPHILQAPCSCAGACQHVRIVDVLRPVAVAFVSQNYGSASARTEVVILRINPLKSCLLKLRAKVAEGPKDQAPYFLLFFFAIRTPKPPSSSSSINWIPACSNAAWILTRVETKPASGPSWLSIRRMVATLILAAWAISSWRQPRSARAARSCAT